MLQGTFLGLTGPQWHAAINDFPVALLTASLTFDLLAAGARRQSLRAAGYWTLLAGAGGALLAAVSGLLVEGRIEQTPAVHRLVETHEVVGIVLGIVFAALAGWRLWRKNAFSEAERQSYTMTCLVAVLALLWTSHLGGNLVFRHAAGIPTGVLEVEIEARADTAAGERQ